MKHFADAEEGGRRYLRSPAGTAKIRQFFEAIVMSGIIPQPPSGRLFPDEGIDDENLELFASIGARKLDDELKRTAPQVQHEPASLNKMIKEAVREALREGIQSPFALPDQTNPDAGEWNGPKPVRSKRSTSNGDAEAKLIAALTTHHQYHNGSCQNLEPVGNNALARLAHVDQSTASGFLKKRFGGHNSYKRVCADSGKLVMSLKLLNGEYSPRILFDRNPPGEADLGDK
jgi:hypothetical protein